MDSEEKCKVMFVDDNPQVGADWKEVLEPKGYEVLVAEGEGEALIENAYDLAWRERPHVIIVDLRLRSEEPDDRQGLELLEEFRAPYILYSAYLDDANLLRKVINEHDQRVWVRKTDAPRQLLEDIEELTAGSCQAVRKLFVNRRDAFNSEKIVATLFPGTQTVPPRLVDDLLCQLFPEANQLSLMHIDNRVHTPPTPRTVSRGRSVVLRVQPDRMEPVVVKLAEADHIERERRRYLQHIDNRLRGHFYAELRSTGHFWELGASCYTFLSTPISSLQLFSAFYEAQKDPAPILRPLKFFFRKVWSHYDRNRKPLQAPSLFAEYDDKLRLGERLQKMDTERECRYFNGIPHAFPNPVRWVLERGEQSVLPNIETAIVHGDLHGDNLFVDGDKAWVIDFERTERSHILRDFVELEVDILTRLLQSPETDLPLFHQLALTVAHHVQTDHYDPQQLERSFPLLSQWQPSDKMRKALGVLAGIRRLAHTVCAYESPEEYLWAVLLTALFAATLNPRGDLQREQALLLSAVICQRLQADARNWPTIASSELD